MERREEVFLCNTIFGENCLDELRKIDKHEIIVKICEVLGPCPSNFKIAEEIFESIKFNIAKYVLHHEYGKENGIRPNLLCWLDSKSNPACEEQLADFISKYLK